MLGWSDVKTGPSARLPRGTAAGFLAAFAAESGAAVGSATPHLFFVAL